ncbi:MAG: CIA30 family protein [Cyanobacteria bacterium P01_A01_bin.135]
MRQLIRWDLCRFVKTLSYFGVLPMLGTGWLQQWLNVAPTAPNPAIAMSPTVFIHADAPMATALAQAVTRASYTPATDIEKAARDASQSGVAGVIAMVSTEEPLAHIQANIASLLAQLASRTLFDFRQPVELDQLWGPVDDVVMGGVSQSGIERVATGALFSGVVSTENSGGFASVRTRSLDPIDLSAYEGIRLRVRGDGNRYKVLLRDSDRWDGVAYSISFNTVPNTWITVSVPFADLVPVFRARTLEQTEGLNQGSVRAFQIMLSKFEYDGELNPTFTPGAFELLIESIEAYGNGPLPTVWLVPDGAPVDRELGSSETLVRVASISDGPAVAGGDRQSLTLKAGEASGAVSPIEVAELSVQVLNSPELWGRELAVQMG